MNNLITNKKYYTTKKGKLCRRLNQAEFTPHSADIIPVTITIGSTDQLHKKPRHG